ncbi:MAG: hypothetical protein J1E42_05865 [Akkermansiaceae bacterium]|nr:hypothetical protein [Akkermansiaceae bacterium]
MDTIYQLFNGLSSLLRSADLLPDFASARGVFCAIAWVASLLSFLSLIIAFFADLGGDADADTSGADGDSGVFSLRAAVGFLLGLGWGGFVAIQCGMSTGASIIVGLVLGILLFFIVAGIMRLIYGLKSDGSLDYTSLIGRAGTVYITIPPHGEPGGQVQVSHPSQLITMPAVQMGDSPLPAQTRIIVVDASTFQLTVRALSANDK